ncbi:tRNA pseudouridine55 synthase [Desulfonatronum thiosulfatophilum]|uniref:tRNA pseudouridine synthase B n=1 Tax=Desulfonatronum thiosulfatophilum TaxID=617002 RepID=A0A1G6DIS2_9BACT|nr:tRNA pseudouridine(55) synthase TruB [Desulfonatronum thiosulfatophilum]SDB45026.1 tRNA pseudouridine55 synthase [Desulfonatronum thiosulfatophilum]
MTAARRPAQAHGVLVLNKPTGPTSTYCLEQIKRTLGQKKIGHAGTLDPLAQGVLLVLLGQGTKIAAYLTEGRKQYQGVLRLGVETDTYDVLGKTLRTADCGGLTSAQVQAVVHEWLEHVEQEVPPYSAAKHQGRPLYALSRAGLDVPVKRKSIQIFQVEVMDVDLPLVRFRVECSAGTYIRSLVHSLGIRLQCGAVLEELIRERSHPFGLEQAHGLQTVLETPEAFEQNVIAVQDALPHFARHVLTADLARKVRHGAKVPWNLPGQSVAPEPGARALFLDDQELPLALVELKEVDGQRQWTVLRGLF